MPVPLDRFYKSSAGSALRRAAIGKLLERSSRVLRQIGGHRAQELLARERVALLPEQLERAMVALGTGWGWGHVGIAGGSAGLRVLNGEGSVQSGSGSASARASRRFCSQERRMAMESTPMAT